jgi:hypothetical protein
MIFSEYHTPLNLENNMASNPPFITEEQRAALIGRYRIALSAQNTHPQPWPEPSKTEPGLRYDSGKARYDLIPPEALEDLAKLYTYGAAKYAERNWEKGMSWSRCFGSLMRHAWAFWRGENLDPESGIHHMTCAAWNCMALFTYSSRAIGTDDRSKTP